MLLREVEYARPANLEEAVRLLGEHDGARALAGGQTLVNVMKQRAATPDVLVDLGRLDELRTIGFSADGNSLEIGSMVTLTRLIGSSEVEVARPILAEVAWEVCNQLGGIYTVLRSKVPSMAARWGSRSSRSRGCRPTGRRPGP